MGDNTKLPPGGVAYYSVAHVNDLAARVAELEEKEAALDDATAEVKSLSTLLSAEVHRADAAEARVAKLEREIICLRNDS